VWEDEHCSSNFYLLDFISFVALVGFPSFKSIAFDLFLKRVFMLGFDASNVVEPNFNTVLLSLLFSYNKGVSASC
jgi:hypothetical protein